MSLKEQLGLDLPLIAAPMAGGPSTPALVIAAARAGAFGFLAAGYKTVEQVADQIDEVRESTQRFGVNVFAPNPVPAQQASFEAYAESLRPEAARFDVELSTAPREDDDSWSQKIDLLVEKAVPVVSFTFGLPAADDVQRLHDVGTVVLQTVTNVEEARQAVALGVDALAVQATTAGGHSGTLTPDQPVPDVPLTDLVAEIRQKAGLPVVAAGGISTPEQVREVLAAGADAAVAGTVLLRTPESGASQVHKDALGDPSRNETVVTTAFSGRPARALRNSFTDRFTDLAPLAYPAVHFLTSPLRKAATAASDPEHVNLWAGLGYRNATTDSAETVLRRLGGDLPA